MGNNFATTFMPYYTPPIGLGFWGTVSPAAAQTEDAEEKRRKQEEEERQKKVAENMKLLEFLKLKGEFEASHKEELEGLRVNQIQAEKTLKQIESSKNKDGGAIMDSGAGGLLRWAANAWTSVKNIGKSIAGYDKDGKWSGEKFALNCVGIAAGIAALWIPGGAFVLGAIGVGGGILGALKGTADLSEAEKNKNQKKIDEAQQDIIGNVIIGALSAFGLKGVGAGFRTSVATAEQASCAAQRTGMIGKTVEGISNFGRDITVNSFKASLKPKANGITPSFSRYKNWETQYQTKLANYEQNLNKQIQTVDDLIQTTTDDQKLTLLLEQRNLLTKNRLEFNKYKALKSKSDIDKLIAKDTKTASKTNIEQLRNYSADADNNVAIHGWNVNADDFMQFQKQMINLQKAYDRSFRDLVKAKENMMRTLAKDPEVNRALLDEYLANTTVKERWWNHIPYLPTKEVAAIGGKNPSYACRTIITPLIHPASNVPKASGLWIAPIHSGAEFLTMELTPEETKAQIDNMNQTIDVIKNLRAKFENAKTKEEYEGAINEYNQLIAASQAQQQSQEVQSPQTQQLQQTA